MSLTLPDVKDLAVPISVAAALLTLIGQWRTFAALGQPRFRDLDERTKAVAFWAAWIAAEKLVTPEAEQPARLAIASKALLDLAEAVHPDETAPSTELTGGAAAPARRGGLRHLLLLRKPKRTATWWVQGLFYIGVAATLGLLAAGLSALQASYSLDRLESLGALVAVALMALAILRQLALLIDGDMTKRPGGKT